MATRPQPEVRGQRSEVRGQSASDLRPLTSDEVREQRSEVRGQPASDLRPLTSDLWVLCACGLLTLAGCSGLKLVPVSGKVTLDGKPLDGGGVSFVPDALKGNKLRVSCSGRIVQGEYQLTTSAVQGSDSGPGAPLGWYKVIVLTTLPGTAEITVDSKYLDPDKTPLSIEVVAKPAPGAYDLKLTR